MTSRRRRTSSGRRRMRSQRTRSRVISTSGSRRARVRHRPGHVARVRRRTADCRPTHGRSPLRRMAMPDRRRRGASSLVLRPPAGPVARGTLPADRESGTPPEGRVALVGTGCYSHPRCDRRPAGGERGIRGRRISEINAALSTSPHCRSSTKSTSGLRSPAAPAAWRGR